MRDDYMCTCDILHVIKVVCKAVARGVPLVHVHPLLKKKPQKTISFVE